MALADTLTTREALRRATLDDIIGRCESAATVIEGGPLDGVKVVSLGTLRDQVTGSLMVKLPPPSEKFAEVQTPATITVSALCPECALPTEIVVKLSPQLTVTNDGAELSVKAKAKARVHVHNQLSLPEEADGQLGMDDVVIDDHRLRILRAVATVGDAYTDAAERDQEASMPTLDAIARELELATESDRFDLQDSLQGYAQADPPLVEILERTGGATTYALTDAGSELIDAADDGDDEAETSDDQDEPS